jgi:hypothetical protein
LDERAGMESGSCVNVYVCMCEVLFLFVVQLNKSSKSSSNCYCYGLFLPCAPYLSPLTQSQDIFSLPPWPMSFVSISTLSNTGKQYQPANFQTRNLQSSTDTTLRFINATDMSISHATVTCLWPQQRDYSSNITSRLH